MNYLLAKIKRKPLLYRVLATDSEVYSSPEALDDNIEYDAGTLLDESEWYKYSNFSDSVYSVNFLTQDFDSVNFTQVNAADLSRAAYLVAVQGQRYYFQVVTASAVLKKKWFTLDELSLQENKPIITINTEADLIYDKASDTLYFKKLSLANAVFKGMDALYREATTAETENFLANDFLELQNGFGVASVKIPNRKRIAMVMDTLNGYSAEDKVEIFSYINDYCDVPFDGNKFEIGTEDHLKQLLFGIEQRFYTTRLGNKKRLANSIIPLN
jgi:hypothetical protein